LGVKTRTAATTAGAEPAARPTKGGDGSEADILASARLCVNVVGGMLADDHGPLYTGAHGASQDDFRRGGAPRRARHLPRAWPYRDDAPDCGGGRHFRSDPLSALRP